MALNWAGGEFAPQGRLETFCLSELEVATGIYWAEIGDAPKILQSSGQNPQTRITEPKIAIVPQLRNCSKTKPFHQSHRKYDTRKKRRRKKKPKQSQEALSEGISKFLGSGDELGLIYSLIT